MWSVEFTIDPTYPIWSYPQECSLDKVHAVYTCMHLLPASPPMQPIIKLVHYSWNLTSEETQAYTRYTEKETAYITFVCLARTA